MHPEATKGGRRDVRQWQPDVCPPRADSSIGGSKAYVNFKGLGEGIQHQPPRQSSVPRDRVIATTVVVVVVDWEEPSEELRSCLISQGFKKSGFQNLQVS